MNRRDDQQFAHARRILAWVTPLLGVLLLPYAMVAEESVGLWLLFQWRGSIAPPEETVVIGIDETTETQLGGPITRAMYAELIDVLTSAGAAVIAFDVFMLGETEHDARIAEAIDRADNVILAARLDRPLQAGLDIQQLRLPTPGLAAVALDTAPWLVPDQGFRIHSAILRDNSDLATMPVAAFQAYTFDQFMRLLRELRPEAAAGLPRTRRDLGSRHRLKDIIDELQAIVEGDSALGAQMLSAHADESSDLRNLIRMFENRAIFRANRLYLNFYGPPRSIVTIPFQDAYTGAFESEAVAGKVAFVGFSALRQQGQEHEDDDYPYVYSSTGFNLSGVEMAATTFANLLDDSYVKPPRIIVRLVIVAAWGVLLTTLAIRLRVRPGLLIAAFLGALYFFMASFLFQAETIWLPIVVPALQLLFASAMLLRVAHLGDRAKLSMATGEEAALALTGRGKPERVDHHVILYADEQSSKKRLLKLAKLAPAERRAVQEVFARGRDLPVRDRGGRINHTLADSMLAYWTTPQPKNAAEVANQVNAACRAALEIHANISRLNELYPDSRQELRLGLDWGEITSHLNPSPEIKDWRMEGVPIHTAERLESLNKVFGTNTLVSQAVASRLDLTHFFALELGTFVFCDDSGDMVVDAVSVYVLRLADKLTDDERALCADFAEALARLRAGHWPAACEGFERLASGEPKLGKLAQKYAEWCQETSSKLDVKWSGIVKVSYSDKSQYLSRYL